MKPDNYTSPEQNARVFENPILQFLSKTHISIPLTIFFSVGILLSIYSYFTLNLTIENILYYFVFGLLAFTLIEYLLHRFLYHLPGVYTEGKIAYALHGIHHKFPRDKKLLVMPPILSITISSIILGINYLIFQENAFTFTGGFLFGYAAYLGVHYMVHAIKPPKNIFKILWVNHSIHHYQDDERAFGVSSPLWDFVFRTLPKKNSK